MKIIHCADLHIDSSMETNLPREKAEQRKEELITAFEKMVKFAVINDVQAIVIAGDLFDSEKTKCTWNCCSMHNLFGMFCRQLFA